MKKIVYFFLLAAFLMACDSKKQVETSIEQATTDSTASQALAAFEFKEMEHDFGLIEEGEIVKHSFEFKNVGEAPLVISNIEVSCGCTTGDYTRTPVAVGESGKVEVQFNSMGKSGKQHKPVTILANVNGGSVKVNLYAEIKEKKAN